MSSEWNVASILASLRDLPSYVVAPVFTFLGGALALFFGPRIKWSIDKKRELREHRRQLIARWRDMVADVSSQLTKLEQEGKRYDTRYVLLVLERHADYASFKSTHDHYCRSGMRWVKRRFAKSWLSRKFPALRPTFPPDPERGAMVGSSLPMRLHRTIEQIAEIERWWRLHK
jgi:hypothetical protein